MKWHILNNKKNKNYLICVFFSHRYFFSGESDRIEFSNDDGGIKRILFATNVCIVPVLILGDFFYLNSHYCEIQSECFVNMQASTRDHPRQYTHKYSLSVRLIQTIRIIYNVKCMSLGYFFLPLCALFCVC